METTLADELRRKLELLRYERQYVQLVADKNNEKIRESRFRAPVHIWQALLSERQLCDAMMIHIEMERLELEQKLHATIIATQVQIMAENPVEQIRLLEEKLANAERDKRSYKRGIKVCKNLISMLSSGMTNVQKTQWWNRAKNRVYDVNEKDQMF